MTTGQTISVRDQGDFARSDDDGDRAGPDGGDRSERGTQSASGARVLLAANRGHGSFDGGWWPRSLRLVDELPGLVEALATADETITRVSVNGDTWADVPARLAHPTAGRPALRVSWFRTLDPYAVTLRSGTRPPLRLLVVPPDTAPGPAAEALRAAATGQLTGPSEKILGEATAGGGR